MDPNHNNLNRDLTHLKVKTHPPTPTTYKPHRNRQISLRRRKLPSVRLGGKKPRRGHFFVRLFRRARLRWLKIKNMCTLKKLKQYYRCLIREIIEASAAMETVQQRVLFDPTSGVPVLGMSFNSYTNAYGP
ncbi:hypothetical protein RHSIM_Rhsim12G0210400 [Rhododendron simsii]|uniref:Uncharacterized protein n=1 Tax=Rhododendron simsii TaxID=118357 RepID=A0A834G5S5_RHOSS|nr:hypothetical protein RHSIM_Rhsim12G0210400 [Rhododendron simsii]